MVNGKRFILAHSFGSFYPRLISLVDLGPVARHLVMVGSVCRVKLLTLGEDEKEEEEEMAGFPLFPSRIHIQ